MNIGQLINKVNETFSLQSNTCDIDLCRLSALHDIGMVDTMKFLATKRANTTRKDTSNGIYFADLEQNMQLLP